MCIIKRLTTGLLEDEAGLVAQDAAAGNAAHHALRLLVPELAVNSESSATRALALVGHRAAEEQLRPGYERAVKAGEIDGEAVATLWAQD